MVDIEATIVQQPVKAEVVQQSVTATIPSAVIINNAVINYIGEDGKSAYELAVENGFIGTVGQWLDSLVGGPGPQGPAGLSAYQVALANGFVGTEPEWLEFLQGADGPTDWNLITNKPSTFTPSSHTHIINDISGLSASLSGLSSTIATKSPIGHTHDIENINGLRDELDSKSNVGHTHDYNTLDNIPTLPDVIIHADEVNIDFSGTEISVLYDPISLVQVYRNGQLLTEGIDRTIFGRDITFEYELTEDIITLSYDHI